MRENLPRRRPWRACPRERPKKLREFLPMTVRCRSNRRGRAAGAGGGGPTGSAGLLSAAHAGLRTGGLARCLPSARPAGLDLHLRQAMLALDGPVQGDLGPVGPPAIPAIPLPVDVLLHGAPAFSPKAGDGREQWKPLAVGGDRRLSVYHGRGRDYRPSAMAFSTSAIARGAPQERQSMPAGVTRTVSSMRTPMFHHRGSALEFSGM
jgi:hypothetical protein